MAEAVEVTLNGEMRTLAGPATVAGLLAEIGLDTVMLPSWYDVDDGESLHLLGRELAGERPPFARPQHALAAAPATKAYLATVLPGLLAMAPGD